MDNKKYTVLVVEDVIFQQKIIRMILEELLCELDIAGTGAEALEFASKNNYDLIFMDLGLGDTDGLTVTEHIRNTEGKNQDTPIIALTAHGEDEIRNRCFQVGMNDFSNKPITQEIAQAMLNKHVYKNS